ncbi:thiol:disulfide interchange protein DsbD [Pedobacter kyungheensis]|uniref:Thiol:disulfide interchange protein DsbD n=1 Tax=Pedobacter kyungheensis TaxID=1069985 RepID=A0A0C1FPG9_9SPHI|nr:cytochrome c biogenesis protein CcdA [Pedobacter kyungheensis]KIA94892.1 thiol:disulfide interchange protein DsbD [Pedobacter kyungheensis]
MKKVLLLLLMAAMFIALPAVKSYALVTQDTTATAPPDDIVFTEVGSAQDSAANNLVKDSVKKDTVKADKAPVVTKDAAPKQSLWVTFGLGLLAGIAAFFLPCIFPMVPLTVGFFTKRAESRAKGIRSAIIYGLSIIVIYVGLGVIITLIWGASALNEISTDGFFNIFIFLILIVFGVSFLGAFEITLPSSFVNKLDAKSDSKGLSGIFFMAATLAVVSFSCTGPLIGTSLVAINTDLLTPVVVMFGFSLSLAVIFTLFAIFPSLMTGLPKSGGWLNSIKVFLGFLELGLSLKFLSTADLAYHWGILDREIFLAIWIVLALILGVYLLGKIKFSHDSDLAYVSVPRLFIATATFVFAIYLIPGLWGAPLKAVSALVPPLSTQDFIIGQDSGSGAGQATSSHPKRKYAEFLHIPHNIDGFFDYEEALAYAREVKKPLFLDFTGHGCVNCREMEARVWSDPRVLKRLKEDYVVVSLYTDDKTDLPVAEQFDSKILGTKVNTVGKKFKHLQAERFNTISQPYYVLLGTDEKELVSPPIGVEFDIDKYLQYLDKGLSEFAKK